MKMEIAVIVRFLRFIFFFLCLFLIACAKRSFHPMICSMRKGPKSFVEQWGGMRYLEEGFHAAFMCLANLNSAWAGFQT